MISALNDTSSALTCPQFLNNSDTSNGGGGDFDWTATEQGTILGAFFYGYIVTQIPGGLLAERYAGKWLFGVGTVLTAILTLLTPVCAHGGKAALIVNRVIMGLAEVRY